MTPPSEQLSDVDLVLLGGILLRLIRVILVDYLASPLLLCSIDHTNELLQFYHLDELNCSMPDS